MAVITCGTNCRARNPFNGGGRAACNAKKACACNVCAPLEAINPNLALACYTACNSTNPPASTQEFYQQVGCDSLLNLYGILECDFKETVQGQSNQLAKTILVGMIGILTIVAGAMVYFKFIKK